MCYSSLYIRVMISYSTSCTLVTIPAVVLYRTLTLFRVRSRNSEGGMMVHRAIACYQYAGQNAVQYDTCILQYGSYYRYYSTCTVLRVVQLLIGPTTTEVLDLVQ